MSKSDIKLDTTDYRKRISFFYYLLAFVFLFGGIFAFATDSIGMISRFSGIAVFTGVWAHVAGAFCFMFAAYWTSLLILENHGGYPLAYVPYVVAVIVSVTLFIIKHG